MVQIMDVLALPPRAGWSIRVNLLSRYGICPLCFEPSLSLLITFPKTIKLLLIYFPSFKRTPSAPVLAILSEPARSTKFKTETRTTSLIEQSLEELESFPLLSITILNIVCDLLLLTFIFVSPKCLLTSPALMRFSTCSALFTISSFSPETNTPRSKLS
ncbi:hypothetical protein V8G54_036112 [Vigna mungo]|uniref:Uncharacterized protein n=1 Tax=Vigna mungo TaxID=3915 RepID=A0AAQ3RF52_VIGMU